MPFLRNVTRGRGVPEERLAAVAEHYQHFGGVSPINASNRALLAALRTELDCARHRPAAVLGQPELEAVRRRRRRGRCATTGCGGRSCSRPVRRRRTRDAGSTARTWRSARGRRRRRARAGQAAALLRPPRLHRRQRRRRAAAHRRRCPPSARRRPPGVHRPLDPGVDERRRPGRSATACTSGSSARRRAWSPRPCAGPGPSSTWCGSRARARRRCRGSSRTSTTTCARSSADGRTAVVVCPTGFVSDHVEVLWDLDTEARETAAELGMAFVRAAHGRHPPGLRRRDAANWSQEQ